MKNGRQTLYTIGYEGLGADEFISLLQGANIKILVDVRAVAHSRRLEFRRRSLQGRLALRGIAYQHSKEVGAPREIRRALKDGGDWSAFVKGYRHHLRAQKEAVARLARIALNGGVCLMCLEADYKSCHRSLLAEALSKNTGGKLEAEHLNELPAWVD
ncbi:MAG: DUF488 domain-containing protein [Phycisphaerae bacterium]|nr:DUF488 domain-containing protein [Phycisphaerae bacterium]